MERMPTIYSSQRTSSGGQRCTNENVILEALRTDVAVTSDVREANAENVLLNPHRTIVAIEDIVVFL